MAITKSTWPLRPARSSLALFCTAALLLATMYPLGIILADPLLTIRDPIAKSDVIVVLGGDGPPRAALTAELWLAGVAPQILISGDGDCGSIRKAMVEVGVPNSAISIECSSGSTWENALFSSPILKRMNVRSGVLVTSWFHSRRALDRFLATSKDIDWISVPVEPKQSLWELARSDVGVQILKEYPKTAWYTVRGLFSKLHIGSGDPRHI